MPEKAIENLSQIANLGTLLWIAALSVWGGVVRYARAVQTGSTKFCWLGFLVETSTAAFAGVITYLLCKAAGVNVYLAAVLIALAGHEGGRAIREIKLKLARKLGISFEEEQSDGSNSKKQRSETESGDRPRFNL